MADKGMFDENKQEPTKETPSTPSADPFVDQLKDIKNEDGEQKYKDVETALAALKASQQHIKTLTQEKSDVAAKEAEARAELERMGNIEDFVNKLKPSTETPKQEETPAVAVGLSEAEVNQLLQTHLKQRDLMSQQENNLVKVTGKLSEVYGEKSAAHLEQRAKELGTTRAALKELAETNPTMALELLVNKSNVSSSPSQNSLRTQIDQRDPDLVRPTVEVGATRGGKSNQELVEMFRKSKEFTNKRIGLES